MKQFSYFLTILLLVSAETIYGQSAKQCYKVSREFIEKGNLQDALTQLNKAIEIDPKYVDAYMTRAQVMEKLGKSESALEDYQRAIVFDPKDEDFYYEAGRLHYLLGRFDESIKMLDKALEIKRGYLEAFQYKIRALIALGKYNDAAAVSEISLNFKENAIHLYLAGVVDEYLKKTEEAELHYTKALKKDPNYTDANLALANLRLVMKKPDKAIESVNIVLKNDPNNIRAYILRSMADTMKLDYSNAINDISNAILIKPNDADLFIIRGTYYKQFTQYQSAINDFSKVLLMNDKNADAYYLRAESYEQIANYKSAIKDYESLVKLSDSDAKAKKMLADSKARLFELNRESNPPQIFLNSPELTDKTTVQYPKGKDQIIIKGRVADESDLKYIKINGQDIPYVKNDNGYTFIADMNLSGKDEFNISVSDVYNNVSQSRYQVVRTETEPPSITLIAPYASDNDQVYLDTNDPNLYIEGNLRDESKIRSILIDGVSASFKLDELNPIFSATINVLNKNKFTVTATDIYGNQSEKTYRINRESAEILAESPMGKTWAVFIENSNYSTFASLEGPTKDVVLMKGALAKYKIANIIHKKDMTKKDMEKFFAIELRDLMRSNRINAILIWFAGHGKFINETGYWIPVDANRDDEFTYYNINSLRAALQSYSSVTHTLVVTDACESGPTFYQAMRGQTKERNCNDWQAVKFKSSQVFSSAGYELAVDNSQFTKTFASVLANNPDACIPIESIVNKVTTAVVQNKQQRPKFGKITGLVDEDGTFFFMTKQ